MRDFRSRGRSTRSVNVRVGARDQAQHALAVLGVDHAGEETPRRLARAGTEFLKHACDAHGLQPGKLHRQRLARRTDIEQPLTPILGALLLHDIAFVDQLLEHAAERLFGDFQDVEQFGDFHAGIAIDEMQHAMMRPAEAEPLQHLVRIADEVAIGKEQQAR